MQQDKSMTREWSHPLLPGKENEAAIQDKHKYYDDAVYDYYKIIHKLLFIINCDRVFS